MFYRSSVLSKKVPPPNSLGFSMVELMVSIGIVVLVLSVVVTRQQAFNSAVLLRGQAYDLALIMREVQLGAISASSDGSGDFRATQGVHFDTTNDQEFRIFRDADGDQAYDVGEDIGFSGIFDPRFELRSITTPSGNETQLSVGFLRPNFDAIFIDGAGAAVNEQYVLITVGLRGGSGTTCGEDIRQVEIRSTGQISVLECP